MVLGPKSPSIIEIYKATSNSALFRWNISIPDDCFAKTIVYSGSVSHWQDNYISPVSNLTILNCYKLPQNQVHFNLNQLSPNRPYEKLTLATCDSQNYCSLNTYEALLTPPGPTIPTATSQS